MPVVFYYAGIRFFFYSNENDEPIHIHVVKGDANGKIWLEPEIAVSNLHGFTNAELKTIWQMVHQNQLMIKSKWYEHFQH